MKLILTLERFVFELNQDEDILVKVIDYDSVEPTIEDYWKSCLQQNETYQKIKNDEVVDFTVYRLKGGNVGLEIYTKKNED